MAIVIPGRVVLFDYGDVISAPQSPAARAELEAVAGVDPARFWAGYNRHRDDLDHGAIRIPEYWARIAADAQASWSRGTIAALWSADLRSWLAVNADVADVIDELRAGGTRLALCSNAGFDYGALFAHAPWAAGFEALVVSAEVGLLKPDPAIYRHAAAALDVTAEEIVFIDNRAVNVEAAVGIGCTGHVFEHADGLRAFLESLAD